MWSLNSIVHSGSKLNGTNADRRDKGKGYVGIEWNSQIDKYGQNSITATKITGRNGTEHQSDNYEK